SGQTSRWAARYSASRSGRTRARKQTRCKVRAPFYRLRTGRRAAEGFRSAPAPEQGWRGRWRAVPPASRHQKLNWLMLALVNTNGGPSRMLWSAPTVYLPSLPAVKDCPAALLIFFEAKLTAA